MEVEGLGISRVATGTYMCHSAPSFATISLRSYSTISHNAYGSSPDFFMHSGIYALADRALAVRRPSRTRQTRPDGMQYPI